MLNAGVKREKGIKGKNRLKSCQEERQDHSMISCSFSNEPRTFCDLYLYILLLKLMFVIHCDHGCYGIQDLIINTHTIYTYM